VTYFRVAQTAALLGVSDDTVRRNISLGRLPVRLDESKRRIIDGVTLAAFARDQLAAAPDPSDVGRSARNHLVGLVTDVQVGEVMAQVEMQCGPHRVVSRSRRCGIEGGLTSKVPRSRRTCHKRATRPGPPRSITGT